MWWFSLFFLAVFFSISQGLTFSARAWLGRTLRFGKTSILICSRPPWGQAAHSQAEARNSGVEGGARDGVGLAHICGGITACSKLDEDQGYKSLPRLIPATSPPIRRQFPRGGGLVLTASEPSQWKVSQHKGIGSLYFWQEKMDPDSTPPHKRVPHVEPRLVPTTPIPVFKVCTPPPG